MTKKTLELVKDAAEAQAKPQADIIVTFRNKTKEDVKFEDILGYQVGGGALGVTLKDGTTFVWPTDLIAEIKHTVKE